MKGYFKARGSRAAVYTSKQALAEITRKLQSQFLPNLRLVGQWHFRDAPRPGMPRPHAMRAMLVANVDVPAGFANGATGRVVEWEPATKDPGNGRTSTKDDRLVAKFYLESSLNSGQGHFYMGVDYINVVAVEESAP